MKRVLAAIGLPLLGLGAAVANAMEEASKWSFSPVTLVQARVQGDMPTWDATNQRFVSAYYTTFAEKYNAVYDTVNAAAVEGALKYVQAECINASVITSCKRKNSVKYVVFYQMTIAQPRAAMAYYQRETTLNAIERCPFVAMDGGQCDPNADGTFPDTCNQYIGADDQPELGFCIGGTLQDSEPIAPYPNNYWFSYPNSCPQSKWADKTDACRAEQAGGMCPLGATPDGSTCTFAYKALGYIKLDDVVGITAMTNPATGKKYADYYEFCSAGGVEFEASVDSYGEVEVTQSLPFWANPGDSTANTQRITTLVNKYNALVKANATTSDGGTMKALPTVASLTGTNPPCYKNNVLCAKARYGCRRRLYSQICEVCKYSDRSGCVVKPSSYTFPTLTV